MYRHYKGIGVARINVHANKTVGGYTWARFGFYADDKNEALKSIAIAQPDTMPTWNKAKKMIDDFYKTHGSEVPFPMHKIATLPGGKELLIGQDWIGHIDMRNAEQVAIFEKYVGIRQ